MILFFGSLYTFGMAIFFIAQNNVDPDLYLIKPSEKGFAWDTIINQYLLSLGDFVDTLGGYEEHPQSVLVWIIFLVTTFVTQITMLNMLIAIMGNTFDNVIEKRSLHAIQMRLSILGEYKNIVNRVKKDAYQDLENFIYVVYPIVDEDEIEEQTDWEGGFNYLRKALNRKIDSLDRSQTRNQQIVTNKQEQMQLELVGVQST